jgi:4-amino-4-deoxy-L-arabinose transferase-like glycosyltransferase
MVLTFPPLFWCLPKKLFKAIFSKFSVLIGLIITAVIAIPWYYFAEKKQDFLDYFGW